MNMSRPVDRATVCTDRCQLLQDDGIYPRDSTGASAGRQFMEFPSLRIGPKSIRSARGQAPTPAAHRSNRSSSRSPPVAAGRRRRLQTSHRRPRLASGVRGRLHPRELAQVRSGQSPLEAETQAELHALVGPGGVFGAVPEYKCVEAAGVPVTAPLFYTQLWV